MGVLYPGSLIAVVSGTAEQATLIVKKIQDYFIRNPEIMREIQADSHRAVQLSRNKGICTLWTALLGILLFGETITWGKALGIVVVLIGVLLVVTDHE